DEDRTGLGGAHTSWSPAERDPSWDEGHRPPQAGIPGGSVRADSRHGSLSSSSPPPAASASSTVATSAPVISAQPPSLSSSGSGGSDQSSSSAPIVPSGLSSSSRSTGRSPVRRTAPTSRCHSSAAA